MFWNHDSRCFSVCPTCALSRGAQVLGCADGSSARCWAALSEFEKCFFVLRFERANVFGTVPQQSSDVFRGTVANAKPNDFWRCSSKNAQTMKILVFGHEYALMLASQLPHAWVGRAAGSQQPDVQGIREEIAEGRYQLLGQLFVEEQTHEVQAAGMPRVRRSRSAA